MRSALYRVGAALAVVVATAFLALHTPTPASSSPPASMQSYALAALGVVSTQAGTAGSAKQPAEAVVSSGPADTGGVRLAVAVLVADGVLFLLLCTRGRRA